jgi:glucose/arabinose dehydrogenase
MTATPDSKLALVVLMAVIAGGAASDDSAQLRSQVLVSGLASPLGFVQDPVDRSVQYVVEQGGRIRVVRGGVLLEAPFLDLRGAILAGGERGLLGLAFAPDHATSGRFFVNFTNPAGHTVVARFRRAPGSLEADPGSRFDLRWGGAAGPPFIRQPFGNHNGGHLAFGPDGYLYIGLGDGGSANDPNHLAQEAGSLLGKCLRVDVGVADDHPAGYVVPEDNPFLDGQPIAALPEIWSFGLRNPWRYSFDDPARGGTGALIIADVGQAAREEINYEPPNRGGRNYGWRNREGTRPNVQTRPPAYLPLTDPVFEYGHDAGQSITGGYVYRGQALGAALGGRYFFGDFIAGRVWSLALTVDPVTGEARADDVVEHTNELGGRAALGNISSFGVDADGELYVVNHSAGTVLQMLGALAPPRAPAGLRIIR